MLRWVDRALLPDLGWDDRASPDNARRPVLPTAGGLGVRQAGQSAVTSCLNAPYRRAIDIGAVAAVYLRRHRYVLTVTDAGYEVRSYDCRGDDETRSAGFTKKLPYEVCLVRRGCFRVRRSSGSVLLDPTTVMLGQSNDLDFEVAHPVPGGDVDTLVHYDAATVAAVGAGGVDLPALVGVSPSVELTHRRVAAAHARVPHTPLEEEFAVDLLAALLEAVDPPRVQAFWPAARRNGRRLVDNAREVLIANADTDLVELAATVGCGPHHLSRLFRRETGFGVAAYRISLRVQMALDGLTEEASSLADLAAACGFYDHAHLTKTLVERFGIPPSVLRAELSQRA